MQMDILVKDGIISKISESVPVEDYRCIDGTGRTISPGICDMQVSGGEPGHEEKETFQTLNQAALAGGVTDLLLMPSLKPAIDNRAQVEYIRRLSSALPVNTHVSGGLSLECAGKDLAELVDMKAGGAISFTDDKKSNSNSDLLHLALQYVKISGGLISVHPEDSATRLGGLMNEGEVSVQLGLKGTASLSEELGVLRAISLSEYHRQQLHINGISTKASVQAIRTAKQHGIQISCSIYSHQLYFDESELLNFASEFKVWPPLRTSSDREALIEGLVDGTIDVICSDHRPESLETKDVEFEFAAYGMIGLETLFGATRNATKQAVKLETLIDKLSHEPRRLLGLAPVSVSEGNPASFFVYTPDESYTFTTKMIRSKSVNSPFPGRTLTGRIVGTHTTSGWFPCVA
jgi:dihydroorotase